jgi:DNA polymerase III delta prime subunit
MDIAKEKQGLGILDIHSDISEQLEQYYREDKVPNIIFHGKNGCGKKTLVMNFINKIYKNEEDKKKYVLIVDCIQSNGIKFIREDLKFFSKSQINSSNGKKFKIIILLNAGYLTIDAQSALRRCIESFSNTTRFFIIIEDKSKILKPVISRFCDFYIPEPVIGNRQCDLYKYKKLQNQKYKQYNQKRQTWLKKYILDNKGQIEKNFTHINIVITGLYLNAYNSKDLEEYIVKDKTFDNQARNILLLNFYKLRTAIKNEKTLMMYLINNIVFRSNCDLENIAFM